MNKVIIYSFGLILTSLSHLVFAQKDAPLPITTHPWQSVQPLAKTEAYFTNLPTDGKVEMPFVLKFGLSDGWAWRRLRSPWAAKVGTTTC